MHTTLTEISMCANCKGVKNIMFNLQTTVRGPMDPAALSTTSQKVIIGISKPMFQLIKPIIAFSLACLLYCML